MSVFSNVPQCEPNSANQIASYFRNDPRSNKVNLAIASYRTDDGIPWVFPVVGAIEKSMSCDSTLNHEYLPILGLSAFRDAALKLCLGEESLALVENRATAIQTISGTGALRLAADFLRNYMGSQYTSILYSGLNDCSHKMTFEAAGFKRILPYRYWNVKEKSFEISQMLNDLNDAPDRSIVILHAAGHDPTGIDPDKQQWKSIAAKIIEKSHFCVFDCSYQGLVSGDFNEDAWAVRYFASLGLEMIVCQSFAANLGIYDERVGTLVLITKDAKITSRCKSQIELLIRQNYSNPPNHGARIVATALSNKSFFREWVGNLRIIAARLKKVRYELFERLRVYGTPGSWSHLVDQKGLFSLLGITETQQKWLRDERAIYTGENGRINISTLNSLNIEYVAKSIDEAVRLNLE